MTPEEKAKRTQVVEMWKILEEKKENLLDSIEEKAQKLRKHRIPIYSKFQNKYPELSKTLIISTPHGYHLYYYMNGFSETSHNRKNACYNEKLKFTGSVKTQFKEYLKGFDCKGEKGYAIIPPSRVDNLYYKYHNEEDIKHITLDDYTKVNDFFLLDKPRNLRKPFKDILNGKIEIEEQANKTGREEFLYWKYLFREAYNFCGLEPKELYKGLDENQPNFDIVKTETQLNHHDFHEKPLTNEKMKELFPEYYHQDKKSKSYISSKTSKTKAKKKREIKTLTPKRIQECEEWLNLPEKEKYNFLNELISFYIKGKETREQALTILFLKLGVILAKELISKMDLVMGDLSALKDDLKIGSETVIKKENSEVDSKVFIVHGRNQEMKESVARLIEKVNLKAIILHEQPNEGKTIIEKFEKHSDVGYAVVLLSTDDKGYSIQDGQEKNKFRARQNVILELGIFYGSLGRDKVAVIYEENEEFEMPTDLLGIAYIPYDNRGAWKYHLVGELQSSGFAVSKNDIN